MQHYKYSQFNIIADQTSTSTLIYNTLTKKSTYLDKEDQKLIINQTNIDPLDILHKYIEDGFVVPANKDEIHSERPYKIEHIDFEVTPFCNENCIHCFNHWRTTTDKKHDAEFNKEVNSTHYTDIAKRICELHPKDVLITGGEPLSVFEKIKESIDLFLNNNIKIRINSNGFNLTKDIAEYIADNHINLFISLPCSNPEICDKITGVVGSFDRIRKAISLSVDSNIDVRVNMVVTKLNKDFIYFTAQYLKEILGVSKFTATKAMMPCNSNPILKDISIDYDDFQYMLDELIRIRDELSMDVDSAWEYSLCGFKTPEQIKQFAFKRKCRAGAEHICFTADGDIKPCSVSNEIYGNILTDNFSTAIKAMKNWRDNSHLPEECNQCKHLKYCGGGCRIDAKNRFNSIRHIDSTYNRLNITIDYEKYYSEYLNQYIHNDK